ncbi:MAG: hypothetical protein ACYTFW_03650, partial [Planctomycetota bacterium]
TMRIMCVPAPRYMGFSLFRNWLELRALEKIRSFGGTVTRIILRGWIRPSKRITSGNQSPQKPRMAIGT